MASGSRQRTRRQQALQAQGAAHLRPHAVTDSLFRDSAFFDPNDLVQVKYEMLRSVEKDGLAGLSSTEARAEAPAQAHRGGPCRSGAGRARGRTHAQRGGIGRALGRALRYPRPPADHPTTPAPVSEAGGKKTPVIADAIQFHAAQYTVQYELLRSEVLGAKCDAVRTGA